MFRFVFVNFRAPNRSGRNRVCYRDVLGTLRYETYAEFKRFQTGFAPTDEIRVRKLTRISFRSQRIIK